MNPSSDPWNELDPVRAHAGLAVLTMHTLIAPYALHDPASLVAAVLHLAFYLLLVTILIGLVRHVGRAFWCIGLLVSATAIRWISPVEQGLVPAVADFALVLCGLTVLVMALYRLARARRVTTALISGAVSLYLLSGVIWSLVFHAIESIRPGSFALGTADRPVTAGDLHYFSFVTLTTLGYGDVSPTTAFARSLAVLEAVFGQVYLIVWLGRLVSLQISSVLTDQADKSALRDSPGKLRESKP